MLAEESKGQGAILIPNDITRQYTIDEVLNPVSDLFRAIIHQGELATMFVVLDMTAESISATLTSEKLTELLKIQPTLYLGTVAFIKL